jgi:outer membrane protein assembly factor BamD (BamD/ComL family)
MAQASRSSSSALSDDPVENLTMWVQANSKTLLMGLGGVALVAAGLFGYRYLSDAKVAKSSAALYAAQGPLLEGNLPEAQTQLQRVATTYAGTAAGQQATLLLAQALYDQKQYQGGISALEKAGGSATREHKAAFEALMAGGYEGLGNLDKAAEAYGKAAAAALTTPEKNQYLTSQARSLMLAGKLEDAKKIFLELAADNTSQYAQEARVRLGEIAGASVK